MMMMMMMMIIYTVKWYNVSFDEMQMCYIGSVLRQP